MGEGIAKQFRRLRGIPVFIRALLPFEEAGYVRAISLVVPEDHLESARLAVREFGCDKVIRIVPGGYERQHSVQAGLAALADIRADVVVVHDGARPLVTRDLIDQVVMTAHEHGASIPVLSVAETVKLVGQDTVIRSLDRTHLRVAQTPQAFRFSWLQEAYERHALDGFTDDAWLIETLGYPVHTVKGRKENLKLTHAEDWVVANKLLDGDHRRVGMGYDVHRLVPQRPLILGGVTIPAELGLVGHSDADVLIHALVDALLGAAGLPDIGQQFPDNDPAYQDMDSCVLLDRTNELLRDSGWCLSNADCTVAAESPKLAPFVSQMKAKMAGILGVGEDQLGIKATTTEGLGFAGRKEGICAWSVVMIVQMR